jgi:hypothetical protein
VPTAPGHWTRTNPVLPLTGTWKTWILRSGSKVRPGPPPAYNSVQMATEMAEVKSFVRTPKTNADALFWEYASGAHAGTGSGMPRPPPRSGNMGSGTTRHELRVYALESDASFCQ